jgi:phosphoribosylglycinamide formyltransferase-1
MPHTCVLLSEGSFHASYLISGWLAEFAGAPDFEEVCVRDTPSPERLALYDRRFAFHRRHAGLRRLSGTQWSELEELYGEPSETERAMIRCFGVPPLPERPDGLVRLLGNRLNSPPVRDWLTRRCARTPRPFLHVFLDRLLAPWWIDLTGGRIVNAHSAVLPYARGMYATEQVAAEQDAERFRLCAGASVHYIDNGVDTGPVIRAERFRDPFGFDTLWDCKAHSFAAAFRLLIATARDLRDHPSVEPAGLRLAPGTSGPDFKSADFDAERRAAAAAGYRAMRHLALLPDSTPHLPKSASYASG